MALILQGVVITLISAQEKFIFLFNLNHVTVYVLSLCVKINYQLCN